MKPVNDQTNKCSIVAVKQTTGILQDVQAQVKKMK